MVLDGYAVVESLGGVSSHSPSLILPRNNKYFEGGQNTDLVCHTRLFPYLRFLKANYSMDWSTFQKYFCDPNANDCYNRISTLLSYTMMRRTMKTSILNRPIITLPKPHPNIQYVHFSPEETIIYRIVSILPKCRFARFVRIGTFNDTRQFWTMKSRKIRTDFNGTRRPKTASETTSMPSSRKAKPAATMASLWSNSSASGNAHPILSCWSARSRRVGLWRIYKS